MGWERKRGKLTEFNRFLRGGATDAFSTIVGDVDVLRRCATSSRSTPTPCCRRDAAPLLVGAIAHPLNRAVYDPAARARGARLRHPAAARRRLAAERAPLALRRDPLRASRASTPTRPRCPTCTRTCTARGASPARASTTSTRSRRRRTAASRKTRCCRHDLIEGNYARAGARHRHRGLRRLSRALPDVRAAQAPLDPRRLAAAAVAAARVPGPEGPERNRLSLLSRWKIFDNLRRSLVEIAHAALPRRGLDGAAGLAAPLDGARAARDRRAVDHRAAARGAPPAARQVVARVLRGRRPRRGHEPAAVRRGDHGAAARGLAVGGRDRAHALAHVRLATPSAAVAVGVAGGARRDRTRRRRLARDVAVGRDGCRRDSSSRWCASAARRREPSGRLVLAIVPLAGALDRSRRRSPHALSAPVARADRAPRGRAPRRRACGTRAHTGSSSSGSSTAETNWLAPDNFQEDPDADRGDAHLADEHRPAAARRP